MFNWFKNMVYPKSIELSSNTKPVSLQGVPLGIPDSLSDRIFNAIQYEKYPESIYLENTFRVAYKTGYDKDNENIVSYHANPVELWAFYSISGGRAIETEMVKTPCVELCNSLIDSPDDWERETIIEVRTSLMYSSPSDDGWSYKGKLILSGSNTKNSAFNAVEVCLIYNFQKKCLQLKSDAAKVAERNELTKLFKGE